MSNHLMEQKNIFQRDQSRRLQKLQKESLHIKTIRANREVLIGDVLQARMAGSNKAILVDDNLDRSLFSTGFVQFRPSKEILSEYLFLYFQSPLFIQQRNQHSSGSTQVAINDKNFEKILIPKPPNDDELYSVCQKMTTALEKISDIDSIIGPLISEVEMLESSLLKSAFDGDLVQTEHEKSANENTTYTNAETLLQDVLSSESEFRNQILVKNTRAH